MTRMIPGGTLGILGGGQLGRMLIYEAHKLGIRTAVLDPVPDGPAAAVADRVVQGAWSDAQKAVELARGCDYVTLETEHIPAEALREVETVTRLRPGAHVLEIVQDRLRQKEFLSKHGFPQPAFAPVHDEGSLARAVAHVGTPAVLKTLRGGYDGKGQARARDAASVADTWASLNHQPCVYEAFIDFEREVSVVLARGADGQIVFYPLAENVHRHGILHTTRAPARVSGRVEAEAQRIASSIAEALGHVGVMAVEMFLTEDEELLVNEIAPRVHNSGHFSFGACVTSQFEQHVRAVCHLPLGATTLLRPVAMLNLLGELWAHGEPDWAGTVLTQPGVSLHLYGKARAAPGRKMGHLLVLGNNPEEALARAEAIHARLSDAARQG